MAIFLKNIFLIFLKSISHTEQKSDNPSPNLMMEINNLLYTSRCKTTKEIFLNQIQCLVVALQFFSFAIQLSLSLAEMAFDLPTTLDLLKS